MSVEIQTVPVVYLCGVAQSQSMYHTAYAPAPVQPDAGPAAPQALRTLTFYGGVARDVEVQLYRQFEALGIATTERPPSRWELQQAQWGQR